MEIHDPLTGKSFFSKRRRRFDEARMPHELTFSCYKKLPFFKRDRACIWFVEALETQRHEWSMDIWSWVIMPDHVHLLVAPQVAGAEVGRFAGSVKEVVARKAVAWLQEHSPLWLSNIRVVEGSKVRHRFWQPGGGYDRNVEETDTLRSMIQYIHQNPVRRGLVERAEDYEWSSARWYAGLSPVRLKMDRTMPLLD